MSEIQKRLDELAMKPIVSTNVPTHFNVLLRLRSAVNDPYASFKRVIDILSGEPIIAAKVVQTANAASLYSQSTIQDVERAVFRLGLATVKRIAMGVVLNQISKAKELLVFSGLSRGLWLNSLYTSAAAATMVRDLCPGLGLRPDEAAFYGLMVNLGGFHLLYRAAQHQDLHEYPEEVAAYVQRHLTPQSVLMSHYLCLPDDVQSALELDQLKDTKLVDPPVTIMELLYAARLLALERFPWDKQPVEVLPLSDLYLDSKDMIEARFETMKAEYS